MGRPACWGGTSSSWPPLCPECITVIIAIGGREKELTGNTYLDGCTIFLQGLCPLNLTKRICPKDKCHWLTPPPYNIYIYTGIYIDKKNSHCLDAQFFGNSPYLVFSGLVPYIMRWQVPSPVHPVELEQK